MKTIFSFGALALAFMPAFVMGQKPPPVYAETLNSDQYGHHKGDIRIVLPPFAADQLNSAIAQFGGHAQCPNPQTKRQAPPDAAAQQARLAALTRALMPLAIPGGALNAFGLQNAITLPMFRDPIVQGQIIAVQAWASCQALYTKINPKLLNNLVELVFYAVRDFCTAASQDLQSTHTLQSTIWILVVDIDTKQSDDNDDHCPVKKSQSPVCQDCGGNDSNQCTTGKYKDCSCLDHAVVLTQPGNRRDLEKAQVVMADLIHQDWPNVRKTDGGDLQCGTAYDQGNANYFAAFDTINRAAAFFCKSMVDRKIKFEAKKPHEMHELHYNNHLWDPI
ncbi:hypothetical protein AMS68_007374 [Peltaster fructicola]|uniref:Uncharacterized protein n=1 Tax=Peltaster fructicola TaxID=286661 RepID=A0A6H0Y4A3_9PEZI|nr:hypothetical protein AMS68_007374 [Peltaster fructicola]